MWKTSSPSEKSEAMSSPENISKLNHQVAYSDLPLHSGAGEKNWFAVFVMRRHEKRVNQHCSVRGIESYVPLLKKQSQWQDGSRRLLEVPLFPSYIFARIGCGGRASILQLPGVILIVGGGSKLSAIPDAYIQFLQEGLQQKRIEPYPYLTVGARVRIRSGVMCGMEGILIRKKNSFRVVLTLDMIMKSITVEVRSEDVEPVGRISNLPLPLAATA